MSENNIPSKKEMKSDKKALVNTLNQAVSPLMKQLSEENQALQMPELALRCAQFFHSISQYCVSYYNNYIRQEQAKKTKLIKKQEKQKDSKGTRRGRKKQSTKQAKQQGDQNRPEPPKKPLTAYIIYFQDKKPLFVQRYPTLNLSELTKLIAKQWKQLSEEQKQVYLDKASQDRKRYQEQLSQFKKIYSKKFGGEPSDLEIKDNAIQEEDISAIINEGDEDIKKSSNKSDKEVQEEEQEEQGKPEEGDQEENENDEGDMDIEAQEEGSGSGSERNQIQGSVSDDSSEEVEQDDSVGPSKSGSEVREVEK